MVKGVVSDATEVRCFAAASGWRDPGPIAGKVERHPGTPTACGQNQKLGPRHTLASAEGVGASLARDRLRSSRKSVYRVYQAEHDRQVLLPLRARSRASLLLRPSARIKTHRV
jgi:hypothetical protein